MQFGAGGTDIHVISPLPFTLYIHYIHYVIKIYKVYTYDILCRSRTNSIASFTMAKTKVLNLRINPELKKKAKQLAEEDGRTLSNWITHLINREVKKAEKAVKE